MPRLPPLEPGTLSPALGAVMAAGEQIMGFTPNDALTMARKPALLAAMLGLVRAVYEPGKVDITLKKLVGLVASSAGGCQYCVAHTAHSAHLAGVADDKLAAVWEYASSPLYSPAERAALDFAAAAGTGGSEVSDADFRRLSDFYDEDAVLELLAVVSLFGFLNRWNAVLATELEASPLAFAQRALPVTRWQPGSHAPPQD
jgi:AhpD family alkylhydroperoxidase